MSIDLKTPFDLMTNAHPKMSRVLHRRRVRQVPCALVPYERVTIVIIVKFRDALSTIEMRCPARILEIYEGKVRIARQRFCLA